MERERENLERKENDARQDGGQLPPLAYNHTAPCSITTVSFRSGSSGPKKLTRTSLSPAANLDCTRGLRFKSGRTTNRLLQRGTSGIRKQTKPRKEISEGIDLIVSPLGRYCIISSAVLVGKPNSTFFSAALQWNLPILFLSSPQTGTKSVFADLASCYCSACLVLTHSSSLSL
ncbi:uncharacterized protein An07g04230 [Aspergillus niger]|uniref:Contig An07c0100, genomic contig n=2 Tax=Aspergillus niger TaxID=5061 RepID=A2QN32_ASPNC|nr:uncharacterized protein An07g04230 [Aspergillus niger]CAK48173.1 unnamed protein product [Aspergillus niger]